MGGAPRNPAPRNHFRCGLSNHAAEETTVECRRPLLGALPPISDRSQSGG